MEKKHYALIGILIGWASFFVFPIEEPAVTYFIGIFLGVIGLFFLPKEKYTHNIWLNLIVWSVLLYIFPEYLIAGLAVGVATHLVIDALKVFVKNTQINFYHQIYFSAFLIFVNTLVVTSLAVEKFLNY